MFALIKFQNILKKYKNIFGDILEDYRFTKVEGEYIIFQNKNENIMRIGLTGNYVNCCSKEEIIERKITFKLPTKEDNSDIKVLEIQKETRPNGCIIEEISRMYGFSRFSQEERVLVDLISERYVFPGNIEIDKFYDTEFREKNVVFKTIFESHMKNLAKTAYDSRYSTDSPFSTKTLLNGEDISRLYDIVDGEDKISRVFDLYNGNITKRNEQDVRAIDLGLLREESFGYKELSEVTKKEDEICGQSLFPKNRVMDLHEFLMPKVTIRIPKPPLREG